jgi:hypothetical protein
VLHFRNFTPVPLWCSSNEHLHEVDEREEESEGHHSEEQQFLVAAHFTHMSQNR